MAANLLSTLMTILALYGGAVLLFLWLTRHQRTSTRRPK